MRKVILIVASLFLLAGSGLAQADKPPSQDTISQVLDSWVTHTESLVTQAANALPEEKYSFAPAVTMGEFSGVRPFGKQVKHLAADNYWMASLILGEKTSPEMYNETGPDSARTKAEIMEYLKGSFVALRRAVATIDRDNVVEPIKTPSTWQKTRLSLVIDAVAHSNDHYGQLVEYLRMNGIVPPASQRRKP